MTNAQHTPGPWEVDADGYVAAERGGIICDPWSDTSTDMETEANARLIAVAPELLSLAQDFAYWDKRYPKSTINPMKGERELDELFQRARDLVAKATEEGKSHAK